MVITLGDGGLSCVRVCGSLSFELRVLSFPGLNHMAEGCFRSFASRFCCGISHGAEVPCTNVFFAEVML